MDKPEKKYKSASEFPNELTVSGAFLAHNKEKRQWTDKQTGQQKQLEVDCVFLQSSIGVLVVRCFNPSVDLDTFKAGDSVCFPVEEYRKENGLKAFIVRI